MLSHPETIVAAAIQIEGITLSLPQPARHGQVIASADAAHFPSYAILGACQGFLTSHGRFVNRVFGLQLAHRASQTFLRNAKDMTHELYSEDLW